MYWCLNTAFRPAEETLIQKSFYKLKSHNQSRQTSTKDWGWLPNCKISHHKLGMESNWMNSANETFDRKTASIHHFSSFGGLFSSFFFCSGFKKRKENSIIRKLITGTITATTGQLISPKLFIRYDCYVHIIVKSGTWHMSKYKKKIYFQNHVRHAQASLIFFFWTRKGIA